MGNEEEKEEEKIQPLVKLCFTHKKMVRESFPDSALRTIVMIVQANLFSAYVLGQGCTTMEDVKETTKGQCPNCVWKELMVVTANMLDTLGVPIKVEDIKESKIVKQEKPKGSIWKM